MHGAAQMANAPPSRKPEPRRRASWTSPAPSRRCGHGSRPMNASPKTIRTKPAICSIRNWSLREREPDRRGTGAEQDEDGNEPGRRTGGSRGRRAATIPARPAAPPRRTRRPRDSPGRAAARRGRETRRSRPRTRRGPRCRSRTEAGELVVEPALRARDRAARRGTSARRGSSSGPRVWLHLQASRPTTAAPSASPASGSTHAISSKPFFGGTASTAGPNWSTSAALISPFVSPAAIRSRMNAFMRSATGAFDVSSVVSQTGQTSSDSSSAAVGRCSLAPAGATRASAMSASAAALTPARARARSRRRAPRRPRPGLRSGSARFRPRRRSRSPESR